MEKHNKKISSGGWIPKRNSGWLLLLLFVSGWMFFLGVLVGRGKTAQPGRDWLGFGQVEKGSRIL
jgi:hypothetical protein